ncbi:MAG: glycosyl hydrolase family 28 protein [Victivallaceae bacterium]|nr:glycosyl hydrolase family 28 protein [Victivallaceae bacterium]
MMYSPSPALLRLPNLFGKLLLPVIAAVSLCAAAAPEKTVINVQDCDAVPNMVSRNTEAINSSIAKCSAAGGGTVLVPAGEYVVGTIVLKDDVTLELPRGTILRGSPDLRDYRQVPTGRIPGVDGGPWWRAMILGIGVKNVRITGGGVIDGAHLEDPAGEEEMRGPHCILVAGGENLTFDNLEIRRASNYAVFLSQVRDVQCRDLKIDEGWDGVHIRGGENLRIENCTFHTGDDCIAGGRWKNVKIADCRFNSACNGFRLIAPAEDLTMENCVFKGDGKYTHRSSYNRKRRDMLAAIILQPGAWVVSKGPVKNLSFRNLTVDRVKNLITIYPNKENQMEDLRFEKIKATDVWYQPVQIENWEPSSSIRNVLLRDMEVEYRGNPPREVLAARSISQPGLEAHNLPYWGFYGRNLDGLKVQNVAFRKRGNDSRSPAHLEAVKNLSMDSLTFDGVPASAAELQKKVSAPIGTAVRIDLFGKSNSVKLRAERRGGCLPMIRPGWAGEQAAYVLTVDGTYPASDEWKSYSFAFKPETSGTVEVKLMGQWNARPEHRGWLAIRDLKFNGKSLKLESVKLTGKARRNTAGEWEFLVNHDNTANFPLPVERDVLSVLEITARNAEEPHSGK